MIQKYWKRIVENEKRKRIMLSVKTIERNYKRHLLRKRFTQYIVVRPIAEGYLVDMAWNLMKFLNKESIEKYLSTLGILLKNRRKIAQY